MTLAQLEQRLENLENTVARLQAQFAEQRGEILHEDDIIDGAEYDFTTTLIPKAEYRVRAKIESIEKPPARLGLSEAEWQRLPLDEDENE